MKKERKLKLEVSKVNISKLNNVIGRGGSDESVLVLCPITYTCKTFGDGPCQTFTTVIGTLDRC